MSTPVVFDAELHNFDIEEDQSSGQTSHFITNSLRNLQPMDLICLTIGTGGLQMIWTAIIGQGSPYLSSLGLPLYMISLIWLSGPLSGALVQPYVSVLSDRCHSDWGRRKPFIFLGTVFTILFMYLLPRSGDFIYYYFYISEINQQSTTADLRERIVAATLILLLNIAIQPVQIGIRALIVDTCPPSQQVQAMTYASCITGIGSVVGYASGSIDLSQWLPWFGNTQFKCLSVVASLALGSTVVVTLAFVKENKVSFNIEGATVGFGVVEVFRQVLRTMRSMPTDMKRICKVQFCAWIGWFSFLNYVTTYIGGLYGTDIPAQSINDLSNDCSSHLCSVAIRKGTLSMVMFAIVALISNLLLPLIVSSTEPRSSTPAIRLTDLSFMASRLRSEEEPMSSTSDRSLLKGSIVSSKLKMEYCVTWLTLPRVWRASHLLTSVLLLSTCLTQSPRYSSFLVALLGISWAVAQWIPLALINTSIAKQLANKMDVVGSKPIYSLGEIHCDQGLDVSMPTYHDYSLGEDEEVNEEEIGVISSELEAGVVLGVYNAAIAAPQIAAALGSSGLFWILTKWEWEDVEAAGWVIRIGALTGLVATWMTVGM